MYGTTQENEKKCLGIIPKHFFRPILDVTRLNRRLTYRYKYVTI